MSADMVNHPPHYAAHPIFTGECHDYAGRMSFDQGNAFKYLWRFEGKNGAEDIRKAVWYLNAVAVAPKASAITTERMEVQRHNYADTHDPDDPVIARRLAAADAMIALGYGDPVAALRAVAPLAAAVE